MVGHACNPSYLGSWGRRITWTREVEVAVSQDCLIVLQPGQQEPNSCLRNKTKQNKTKQKPDSLGNIPLFFKTVAILVIKNLIELQTWIHSSYCWGLFSKWCRVKIFFYINAFLNLLTVEITRLKTEVPLPIYMFLSSCFFFPIL